MFSTIMLFEFAAIIPMHRATSRIKDSDRQPTTKGYCFPRAREIMRNNGGAMTLTDTLNLKINSWLDNPDDAIKIPDYSITAGRITV